MKYIDDEGKMCTLEDSPVVTLEERIKRLEDINSIKEVMYHYMHYCDNLDPYGMASCFTETGKLSWGDVVPGYYNGRAEIYEQLKPVMAAAKTQTHYCTNQQIYFESSDSAIVYCTMYSWQKWKDETQPDAYSYGRYETQVVRDTDGEWRFQSFKLIYAGSIPCTRECEQFDRPWPPVPIN